MPRIIPPILLLIAVITMLLLHQFLPIEQTLYRPFRYLGIPIILLGWYMAKSIKALYQRHDTEINTFKKPRKLVTEGLFKHSRNPIYLGMVIMLIGAAILLGSLITFTVPIIFFLIINLQHVPFEEAMMEQTFGDAYLEYKGEVRRWI